MSDILIKLVIIIISDRAAQGTRKDETLPHAQLWCRENSFIVIDSNIVSDDPDEIRNAILQASKNPECDLIITSGGTGFSDRDNTPEVTGALIEKPTPGIEQYLRSEGMKKTPYAALSRGISGIIKNKLIVNLPGNPQAVIESLGWLKKIIPHAIMVLKDQVQDRDHNIKRDQ